MWASLGKMYFEACLFCDFCFKKNSQLKLNLLKKQDIN